jgi:exodeoxyribonuclease VII large subunit
MNQYTVSQLTDVIKKALHIEFKNNKISVSGEISNLKVSGKHTYLDLKDDQTQLSVVFWGTSLDNKQGDHVEISGRVELYAKSGKINFIGSGIKNIGIGSLHTEYEKIKLEYENKGYFNNKKPLPKSINKIGIITSANGAALKDFLYVLEQSQFAGYIYIYDCAVQGANCPQSVAQGIKFFNSAFYPKSEQILDNDNNSEKTDNSDQTSDSGFDISDNKPKKQKTKSNLITKVKSEITDDVSEVSVDCVIISRGGGSFEDLMGFSDPKILNAIYGSNKYTISAVGHEIDNMLSDYVANYRAPTPSIAGSVVCSVNYNNKKRLTQIETNINDIKKNLIQQLYKFKKTLKKLDAMIFDPREQFNKKLNDLLVCAKQHVKSLLTTYSHKLNKFKNIINSNDVTDLLNHGFIMLTDSKNHIIMDPKNIFDKKINLIHSSGNYEVIIKKRS